jgi:hypothetical protein
MKRETVFDLVDLSRISFYKIAKAVIISAGFTLLVLGLLLC